MGIPHGDDLRYAINGSIFRDLLLAFASSFAALLRRGTKAEGATSMLDMAREANRWGSE